MRADQAAKSA